MFRAMEKFKTKSPETRKETAEKARAAHTPAQGAPANTQSF
jgi:hypothetical protein